MHDHIPNKKNRLAEIVRMRTPNPNRPRERSLGRRPIVIDGHAPQVVPGGDRSGGGGVLFGGGGGVCHCLGYFRLLRVDAKNDQGNGSCSTAKKKQALLQAATHTEPYLGVREVVVRPRLRLEARQSVQLPLLPSSLLALDGGSGRRHDYQHKPKATPLAGLTAS